MSTRRVSDYNLTPDKGSNDQIDWGSVAKDFSSNILPAWCRGVRLRVAVALHRLVPKIVVGAGIRRLNDIHRIALREINVSSATV